MKILFPRLTHEFLAESNVGRKATPAVSSNAFLLTLKACCSKFFLRHLDRLCSKSRVYFQWTRGFLLCKIFLESPLVRFVVPHRCYNGLVKCWRGDETLIDQSFSFIKSINLSLLSNVFHDLSSFIRYRSSNRQNSLQESLDRLLLFHKNMITALTWLSSAESKVADLDSIVEASQTEEQIEMDELHKELAVCCLANC